MTKKCVQCGKSFTLTKSEIDFYKSKNLNIPKRCKDCRSKNKASKESLHKSEADGKYRSYYIKSGNPINLPTLLISIAVTIIAFALNAESSYIIAASALSVMLLIKYIAGLFRGKVHIQEFDTSIYKYTFYDTKSMVRHYVKHGAQTDCRNMEDYLYKANKVITDKNSLTKKQKKDNDTIFYNKRTNEFVVVAKAGYVRTYFIASDKYYNKQ